MKIHFASSALVWVLCCSAQADIINVPADHLTIQEAIVAANFGDVVNVAPGTYIETINFLGKAITVRSTDPNDLGVVMNTIIDGTGNFHVVQCITGEGPDTVLSGFIITGGNANGAGFDGLGGGMFNFNSSPTVSNCSFTANTASGSGGGMFNTSGSSPTVTNCSFSGNTADSAGGGMFNTSSSPTVTNCSFSGNMAITNNGGGMYNSGSSPIVTSCSFSGNRTNRGGGMYNTSSSPTVTYCSFSRNAAATFGGGVFNTNGSPTVINCSFSGNTASGGGGIFNLGGSPTVTNTGFCNNMPDQIFGSSFSDGGGNSLLYCPPPIPVPPSCPADSTGPGGVPDGLVNVDDLIILLAAWGACL